MKLKRLLGAENGWGGALGTLLLLGFGLALLLFSVAGLRDASRLAPEERGCNAWLTNPSGVRWVTLVGCNLTAPAQEGGVLIPLGPGAMLATSGEAVVDGGVLTGWVERRNGQVVLEQGRQPPRKDVVLGMLVGVVAVAMAVRSMFMRYLVDRESTS